jgi:hypothetical protein
VNKKCQYPRKKVVNNRQYLYYLKAKVLLKEGSRGADVNEGKFVLNIDALFAFNIL